MPRAQDFFPYPFRDQEQERVAQLIIDNWHRFDVCLLVLPVAFGKSPLAKFIMNYANSIGALANWITPDNALVKQAVDEFPDVGVLRSSASYGGGARFARAKAEAATAKQTVMNPYTLLANRIYKSVHIFDEFHTLLSTLQDFGGLKVWEGSKQWHPALQNVTQALLHFSRFTDAKSKKLVQALSKRPDQFCVAYENDILRGQDKRVLRIYQLSPKDNPPILWPPHRTKKVFLMSATASNKDVDEMGLSSRRVFTIHAGSSIPPENRPFILDFVGSMDLKHQHETLPKIVTKIGGLMDEKSGRGFIHATYNVAAKLRADLGTADDRLVYHTKFDKSRKLGEWMPDTLEQIPEGDNRVFVGSGLTQGLNLKYDYARWQVIAKCMRPNLGDNAVRAKAGHDPEWYAWVTIREILQAYGRVSRAPDDFGETRMLDSAFWGLYKDWNHLFPRWFHEAVV